MTTEPKEVYKAIAAVTRALGRAGIGKNRENKNQHYRFRGIDDIYNALNGELADANLCIIPRVIAREVAERTSQGGGALFYVTIHAEYDIVSALDGSMHTASAYGEAMDSGDKATNKAMSAAYKYMAMQLFCIPTEGDNDADSTTHEVQARGATYNQEAQDEQVFASRLAQKKGTPAPANGSAPKCDVCGTPGRKSQYSDGYYCPAKENHGGKSYTIKPADTAEWDAIDKAASARKLPQEDLPL